MKGNIEKINSSLIQKKYSCLELTKAFLDNIKVRDKAINSYITVTEEKAIKTAKEVDRKISAGEKTDILSGIPYTLKDNIITSGIKTTCASKMLENFVPVYNSCVYDLLTEKSSVLLGKTNLDEFAMGGSSESSFFGAVKNPWDVSRVSGGSSGGSAAAVASDMAVFALGSDTGGSVRQPAAFCGCLGLKPTYGAISRWGLVPYASGLDCVGIITKSCKDAGIVFSAVCKKDCRDMTSVGFSGNGEGLNSLNSKKIAIFLEGNETEEIKQKVNEKARVFEELGAEICYINIDSVKFAIETYSIIAYSQASSNLSKYDGISYGYNTKANATGEDLIRINRSEGFGEEVKKRILLGNLFLSDISKEAYYVKAEKYRKYMCAEFEKLLIKYDYILLPTCEGPACKFGNYSQGVTDKYTVFANLTGLPAVSFPAGLSKEGLPLSLQLLGRRFSEYELLDIVAMLENIEDMYKTPGTGGITLEL